MTATPPGSKRHADRRAERHQARSVLRTTSSNPRIRDCGLYAAPRAGGEAAYVAVKVTETPNGARAGISGVSVCGNTWSCPCCSERIQTERNLEVRAALANARRLGLVVAFATFTVRHRRGHSLTDVWEAVSGAWRAATGGAGPTWEAERDDYGLAGYLRLTEATYGDSNGWHVHIHALLFLDPAGRLKAVKAPLVGPLPAPAPRPVPERLRTVMPAGPATLVDSTDPHENVAQRYCPISPKRRPVAVLDVAGNPVRERVSAAPAGAEPRSLVALVNDAHDEQRRRGVRTRSTARAMAARHAETRGIYLRDVETLGGLMFARWSDHLRGLRCRHEQRCTRKACQARPCGRELGFTPDDRHGFDVRLVTDDGAFLADYFAKNRYSIKTETSAAFDVTGSHAKQAKRGNLTPFGLLARVVNAAEVVDETTGELRRKPARVDVARWQEWERGSKGRRQLLWSNGLRDLLGLDAERSDEEIAADVLGGSEVLALAPAGYRRIERAGLVCRLLGMVERGEIASAMLWLDNIGVANWRPGEDPPDALAAA